MLDASVVPVMDVDKMDKVVGMMVVDMVVVVGIVVELLEMGGQMV